VENQPNSKTDYDSGGQTTPESQNEQQATSENNQPNADIATHEQQKPKLKVL